MKRQLSLFFVSTAAAALVFAGAAPAALAHDGSHHGGESGTGLSLGLGLDLDLGLGLGQYRYSQLTGKAEVPGPGDPDGRGQASVRISRDKLCVSLTVRNIQPATAAHIHRGAKGTAGPVVVNLAAPSDGTSYSCVQVDRALTREIAHKPGQFYVNVHNAEYPAGAVRGQLQR
ncbi:CHRD domain-containing protein [Lentzea sp. NPDC051208]|uniref:CHRD domain-containing protein n=1 Tax=Lentzea sp. NPDC051208 TaxID=3154642 RepID=UPI00342B4AE0